MPSPVPALVDWQAVVAAEGEKPTPIPGGKPLLVRTGLPGREYAVALWLVGVWRMSGAQERVVYGVTDGR